ncbi:MAG TPA: ferritin-like domain-containing protein [Allosphingosinicella sp.]|uniref:ferritin-like domain-containing protein n=1 Tax=Allosphingosinicella sp. TaxID=2823234 RepID=UPI002F27D65A
MNNELKIELIEATEARRTERRAFLRTTASVAAVTAGGSLLASCSGGNSSSPAPTPPPTSTPGPAPAPSPTPTPSTNIDPDIFNFALNLEYLEAQFYVYAVSGQGLPDSMLSGTGTRGNANFTGARQVPFQDPVVRAYAREIAADEEAHVAFLRRTLSTAAVAQPALDLSVSPTSAFSNAARAAMLIGAGQSFDPYADDNSFLLGAFIFEDVGVTAYKGAARLITNKGFLEAAAGILAAEAYHAGLIRTVLYGKGIRPPTEAISAARDGLDGASDIDQGVAQIGDASNIVPTDGNGLAFSRSAGQVLNIVYLNRMAVTAGGFFPAGVNGNIRTSAAN